MSRFTGACYCGAVQFEIEAPTRFCAHCHCQNCRAAHGSAFVTWVGVPDAQLHFVRGEELLRHYKTETDATRSFCGTCGTTLFYRGPRWPDEYHVTRASIAGEIDRPPKIHIYVDHKSSWFPITYQLPQFGGKDGLTPKQ